MRPDFLARAAVELTSEELVALVADQPGRLGPNALGQRYESTETRWGVMEHHWGEEETEFEHGASVLNAAGKLGKISYVFHEAVLDAQKDQLRVGAFFSELEKALRAKLGKPVSRTKRAQEYAWDGGTIRIERQEEHVVQTSFPYWSNKLSVMAWGTAPWQGATPNEAKPESAMPRPDPDSLVAELNGVLPDCFDCGVRVEKVGVEGDGPYQLTFHVSLVPGPDDDERVHDSCELSVDGPEIDVCSAAVEAIREVVSEHSNW